MVTLFRSPLPFSTTLTTPPPEEPSISIVSSSACIACILDCSSAAFFIMPMKSAMSRLSLLAFGVVVFERHIAVRSGGGSLSRGRTAIISAPGKRSSTACTSGSPRTPLLEFGLARIGLRLQGRLAGFARQGDEPFAGRSSRKSLPTIR